MSEEKFRAIFEETRVDATLPATQSIRSPIATQSLASGPTVAMSKLPSVDLRNDTNPELELGPTIGEGGMGVVRSARQLALHRDVAVKTLRPGRDGERAAAGLLQEALVTGAVEHPNIVPIYSIGETTDGAPIIVMKRIEGVPWESCIDDIQSAPADTVDDELGWHLDVFTDLCRAVEFAHSRDIIHRDIKPENVMIGSYGEVYLLDWGVAVTTNPSKRQFLPYLADSPGVVGTPCYMAPEMTTGHVDEIGVHTDVYLLGATLFHALTGRPPHSGQTLFEVMFHAFESKPGELPDDVPDGLARICHRAMARASSDRYESVADLRRDLAAFRTHRTSIALTETANERLATLVSKASDTESTGRETEVRNLFGECRFGFGEALRIWPENKDARRGLDQAIEQMARFELQCSNLAAAEAWVSELDSPSAELRQAVEDLRDRLADQKAELEALRSLRDEQDLAVGAEARRRAAAIAAVFFALMPLTVEMLPGENIDVITSGRYVMHSLVVFAIVVGLVVTFRDKFLLNRANRRITRVLIAYVAWTFVFRVTTALLGINSFHAFITEMTTYGLTFAAVAIVSDWRAWFGLMIYSLAALLAAFFPEAALYINAAANGTAIGWLGWLWSHQVDHDEKVSRPD